MEVRNKRWSDDEFLTERKEVLRFWHPAKKVELDEAIEYQKRLPEEKVYAKRVAKGKKDGQILTLLRLGKARVEETIDELRALSTCADLLDVETDGYTRKAQYAEAQKALEQSYREGSNLLCGYPYVCHGVKTTRRLVEASARPLLISSNDEDTRILDEIGMASGLTAHIIQDVRDLLAHSKNYSLPQRIHNCQYTCRLATYYSEHGAPMMTYGVGSNLPFSPPGMGIVLVILESLTAATQGVKNYLLCYDQRGQLIQDVVAFRTTRKLARKYLDQFGFRDVDLSMRSSAGNLPWPRVRDASAAQAALCTVTGVLAGVDVIRTKALDEGLGIPSLESQLAAGRIARHVVNVLGKIRLPESDEVREERRILELEVQSVVDRVIELGDGDIAIGEMKAVEQGVIDVPFSPWIYAVGKVFPVRDLAGAVRWLETGNVPLPREVIDYHHRKIAERRKSDDQKTAVQMLIEDLAFRTKPVAIPV